MIPIESKCDETEQLKPESFILYLLDIRFIDSASQIRVFLKLAQQLGDTYKVLVFLLIHGHVG
jgi:hypothetical protein